VLLESICKDCRVDADRLEDDVDWGRISIPAYALCASDAARRGLDGTRQHVRAVESLLALSVRHSRGDPADIEQIIRPAPSDPTSSAAWSVDSSLSCSSRTLSSGEWRVGDLLSICRALTDVGENWQLP